MQLFFLTQPCLCFPKHNDTKQAFIRVKAQSLETKWNIFQRYLGISMACIMNRGGDPTSIFIFNYELGYGD